MGQVAKLKRTWNLAPVYSKMLLDSCTNTHHDVTDLVNHAMVKNMKTWISWERNIIYLPNKKILNLCFRWHILRSYHFVAEVTFKLDALLHKTHQGPSGTKVSRCYCTFVPPPPIVIDDPSWKNVAESFTKAIALTLGGMKVQ